ncbi:MAG: phospho-sugar mutase, partial [Flavobacteriaceae bacterium]
VFTPIHGTSVTAIPQVLKKAGYKKIYIVKEQEKPDGNFSTVSSPNPEEKESLKMAVELAEKKNADIVIGTDPDADRLGIAIRNSKDDWYYLNGNQIMIVLTEYLLSKKKTNKQLNSKNFIASTIVSSPIIKIIANAYGIKYRYCLTGFKWIAKLIKDHPELEFVCGGEESFGFLVGNKVRDKDAISASLLACELASELKSQNKNIYKFLIECYKKYGIYNERLKSIKKEGKAGLEEIKNIMTKFRKKPPLQIAGINTLIVEDYSQGTILNLKSGKKESISLPKSDVLIFILEDKSRIGLRPSGTEPKIKFYFSVSDKYKPNDTWEKQQERLNKKIDLLLNDIIS